jgi:hypothetical protein
VRVALFARPERPPADLLAGLGPDERLLAFADTATGGVVAATTIGLRWPEPPGSRLIAWDRVDKVIWRDNLLSVIEADLVEDTLLVDRAPVTERLQTPRDLPPVVRKRVEANIVRSELLAVGTGAVRFVARRRPGRDGVAWWARLEAGTEDTEDVRSAVRARLAILRAGGP